MGIIFKDINECFDSFWPKDQFDKVWGCIVTANSEEEFKEQLKVLDKHNAFKYTFGGRIKAEIVGNWTTNLDLLSYFFPNIILNFKFEYT